MARHCILHSELSARPFILWEHVEYIHTRGKANIGRRRLNYVNMLRKYNGLLERQVIRTIILD